MSISEKIHLTFDEFKTSWLDHKKVTQTSDLITKTKLFATHLFADIYEFDYQDIQESVYCVKSTPNFVELIYCNETFDDNTDSVITEKTTTWYLILSKTNLNYNNHLELKNDLNEAFNFNFSSDYKSTERALSNFLASPLPQDRLVCLIASQDNNKSDEFKSTLQEIERYGKSKFGNLFEAKEISIRDIYDEYYAEPSLDDCIQVELKANLLNPSEEQNSNMLAGAVRLLDLYHFLDDYKIKASGNIEKIFDKNVRRFLSFRGNVNKAIKKTLLEKPQDFGLYNNGITMVVKNYEKTNAHTFTLYDPYIVNGCQTTTTIYRTLNEIFKTPNLDDEIKYRNSIVLLKIAKVTDDSELIDNITQYTNNQNAVKVQDFSALHSDLRLLKDEMAKRYDIFLELKKGDIEYQKALQNKMKKSDKTSVYHDYQIAKMFDLIKIYGAGWLGKCGEAYNNNRSFSPGGKVFNSIINSSTGFNLDDLKISFELDQIIQNEKNQNRGRDKQGMGQTKFLFCKLFIDLFKTILCKIEPLNYENNRVISSYLMLLLKDKKVFDLFAQQIIDMLKNYLNPSNEKSLANEPIIRSGLALNDFFKRDTFFNKSEIKTKLNLEWWIDLTKFEISRNKLDEKILSVLKAYKTPVKLVNNPAYEYAIQVNDLDLSEYADKFGEKFTWVEICKFLKIDIGRSSARLALARWVKNNKPFWPKVPE